jgi:ABC-2 type transport system permease protein
MSFRSSDQSITYIQPPRSVFSTLGDDLAELWRCRRLVVTLAARQLAVRYKNSALGLAWSLILPLVQAFTMTFAVSFIMGTGPRNMGSFILCAYLPWTFFQSTLLDGSSSVLLYQDLLKKVYMPREVLPISAGLANLVHFLMAFIVFLVFRFCLTPILYGGDVCPPLAILWFPVVLAILFAYSLGITFFLCAWTTFYEDVKYLVATGVQLLFFVTPIMYFAEKIYYSTDRIPDQKLAKLVYHIYLLNPIAWLVTAFKQMFFGICVFSPAGVTPPMHSAPFDWRYCAIDGVISFAILLWGYLYFNHMKWKFTERP